MKIERFEDFEAWLPAPVYRRTGRRELTRKVYREANPEPENLSSYQKEVISF